MPRSDGAAKATRRHDQFDMVRFEDAHILVVQTGSWTSVARRGSVGCVFVYIEPTLDIKMVIGRQTCSRRMNNEARPVV